MANPDPDIDASGLLFLEDAVLPELTNAFRTNLRVETFYSHVACVERYGTPDLLPDVVRLYELHKGAWACEIAERCLGFMVKHNRARGLMLIEEAVGLRSETGCYHDVLLNVLKPYPGPDVLALACKYVADSDDGIATTSASLVAIQVGGKDRLRAMIASERYRLSPKTLRFIETQLLTAPN